MVRSSLLKDAFGHNSSWSRTSCREPSLCRYYRRRASVQSAIVPWPRQPNQTKPWLKASVSMQEGHRTHRFRKLHVTACDRGSGLLLHKQVF